VKEERSYGVILIFREKENKFLLIKNGSAGHWGFPKGHKEEGETDQETALRELKEEAGIENCEIIDSPELSEEYTFEQAGQKTHKITKYFIGFAESKEVKVQKEEIAGYKWATYEEAIGILTYENNKRVLKEAINFMIK
jgi:bis(5'-nucleosidyl)-tetraphosphatase